MDNCINVSYSHVNTADKEPVLLYSIGEVSKETGVETSTIRHWSNKYYDFLDVQFCNTHRRYTKLDIDKLKIIKKCQEKKMSHNEIINTLKETNFDISIVEKRFLDSQQPLDVQLFASAISVEIESRINAMEQNIVNVILEKLKDQNNLIDMSLDKQREDISVTVDEILNEKLSNTVNEFNNSISEIKEELKIKYIPREEVEHIKKEGNWLTKLFNR